MKIIKGTFDYQIHITEKDYVLDASPKIEDEMTSIIVVNMLLNYSKDTILQSLQQASGKHLNLLQDRLGKINSAISVMQLMGSDYARELMLIEYTNSGDDKTQTQEPIMGLEDVKELNKTETYENKED